MRKQSAMNQELMEQAADWFDRQDELTPEEQGLFASWLQQDDHLAAYTRISRAMGEPELNMALLASQSSQPIDEKDPQTQNVIKLTQTKQPEGKAASVNSRVSKWLPLAAGIMCLTTALTWFLSGSSPSSSPQLVETNTQETSRADYIAAVGARESKLLEDGTLVHLNANSELKINQLPKARQAVLNKGQAYFNVAHNKHRPFTIDAGLADILVVGTEFDVDRLSDRLVVTVYEGHVKVTTKQTYDLYKGERITLIKDQQPQVDTVKLAMLPDWRDGWLDVNQLPLSTVVEKVQRYLDKTVVLDPHLNKNMSINGRFALDQPQQTLRLLAKANKLSLDDKGEHLLLRPL